MQPSVDRSQSELTNRKHQERRTRCVYVCVQYTNAPCEYPLHTPKDQRTPRFPIRSTLP